MHKDRGLGSNARTKLWKVHHLSRVGDLQRNDRADGFPYASVRVLGVKEKRLGYSILPSLQLSSKEGFIVPVL